ncbi:MAG: polyprenyl synthetase family protein [Alloprevotella sp.]|nr:polyprenyl synthetase family protein [Alloprevotella sp.]
MQKNVLETLRQPIVAELDAYRQLFAANLTHSDAYLDRVLSHIRGHEGKLMRPMLTLLSAKAIGEINPTTLQAAVALELLHTASLVHDDIVDESNERRGLASTNAQFGNQTAVLIGDFLLARSLATAAQTGNLRMVEHIAMLGATLSEGEIAQLQNISNAISTEDAYYHIIAHKTAALFSSCGFLGTLSVGADDTTVQAAQQFAHVLGLCFQIRDDIFDYFDDKRIGKPTGNDMAEGKLTLPAIYALREHPTKEAVVWAEKVKAGTASRAEILSLVEFSKQVGGIDYAQREMARLRDEALPLLHRFASGAIADTLQAYLDFSISRES